MTGTRHGGNNLRLDGVWLPIVTPFRDGCVDFDSFRRLIAYYRGRGIAGFVVGATTGESQVLSDEERHGLARVAVAELGGQLPVIAAAGGSNTAETADLARSLEQTGVDGLISVAPYYNRPSQSGLVRHFEMVAAATALPIVLYNIPYRTGVNIENATIRQLARVPSIVGLKDSCGDLRQSSELLLDPPDNFSIVTGDDSFFFSALALGARGGILASAHWLTETFVRLWRQCANNDLLSARAIWHDIAPSIPLFFQEPNPSPLKDYLALKGLIVSPEVRLPLVNVSASLHDRLTALCHAEATATAVGTS